MWEIVIDWDEEEMKSHERTEMGSKNTSHERVHVSGVSMMFHFLPFCRSRFVPCSNFHQNEDLPSGIYGISSYSPRKLRDNKKVNTVTFASNYGPITNLGLWVSSRQSIGITVVEYYWSVGRELRGENLSTVILSCPNQAAQSFNFSTPIAIDAAPQWSVLI